MIPNFQPAWWIFAVASCALLLGLAVMPPFVGPGFRHALMMGFDLTCHQIPERSFQVGGIPFALCHRCTGVVAGLVLGTLAVGIAREADGTLMRNVRLLLLGSLLPLALDWGVDVLGVWTNTPFSRAATGAFFGMAAGFVFARALSVRALARTDLLAATHPFTLQTPTVNA